MGCTVTWARCYSSSGSRAEFLVVSRLVHATVFDCDCALVSSTNAPFQLQQRTRRRRRRRRRRRKSVSDRVTCDRLLEILEKIKIDGNAPLPTRGHRDAALRPLLLLPTTTLAYLYTYALTRIQVNMRMFTQPAARTRWPPFQTLSKESRENLPPPPPNASPPCAAHDYLHRDIPPGRALQSRRNH